MTFFPALAVWIAIGVRELMARFARLMPRAAAGAITVAVVLAAMAGSGVQACRTASLFGWPDPRDSGAKMAALAMPRWMSWWVWSPTAVPVDHLFHGT